MQTVSSQNKHDQIGHILDGHERRLMSLQVTLQTGLRDGQISQTEFDRRFAALKHHLREIKDLSAWHGAESVALTQESNLGLPDLEQCSPEERQVCLSFLRRRHGLLEQLLREATKAYGWIVDASRGKGWPWLLTWRLSAMKRLLQKLDLELNGLIVDNEEQDKLLAQIAKSIHRDKSEYVQDNLETLMKLFNNLDYAAAKVAHLKANIRREEQVVTRMQNWLSQYEKKLVGNLPPIPPPALAETRELADRSQSEGVPLLSDTARKLTLARSYVQTQLQDCEDRFGRRRRK